MSVLLLGTGQNMADSSNFAALSLPASAAGQLRGMSRAAQQQVACTGGGGLCVPTHEHMLGELLAHVPDRAIRQQVHFFSASLTE